ncbi:MAG: bacillithiol system redox-active protein YtxJ [Raineya sp.]|jgi:bacillithiol system protein YtxJ|nr:bacillithiol system redox-active protein YtxJ [Raineya sp.]
MNWIPLENLEQLEDIKKKPKALIFKHSTRCSISATALDRLQRQWNDTDMQQVEAYYLDLIKYRDISNKIAEIFSVEHQSPQALLLSDGNCIYHDSHYSIDYQEIKNLSN